MKYIHKLLFIFVLSAVALSGCNLAVRMSAPTDDPAEIVLPTALPTSPSLPAAPAMAPTDIVCASAVTPGRWLGDANFTYTAGTAGVTVINQGGLTRLDLVVNCDGSVTGTVQEASSSTIAYPLFLSGACEGSTQQTVSGWALPPAQGDANPHLLLHFDVPAGSVTCNLDSRLPNIPSGQQTQDLSGKSYDADLVVEAYSNTSMSGSTWTDFIYLEQAKQVGPLVEQTGLEGVTTSSWQLTLQP